MNPMLPQAGDEDDSAAAKKVNKIGQAMGDGLKRPIGSKAAKKLEKDALSTASIAKTKADAMSSLAKSNARMARTQERKNTLDIEAARRRRQEICCRTRSGTGKASNDRHKLANRRIRCSRTSTKRHCRLCQSR